MALHYFNDYELSHDSRNFGDSINPELCNHFFHESIIDSKDICLLGIGTILNDRNIERVRHFRQKIVFSSGTGYGDFNLEQKEDWDFACVRGPLTAQKLELPAEKAICDGAILLAELFPPKPAAGRSGTLFIPHVNTVWSSGKSLRKICSALNMELLSPAEPAEKFINAVRNAELVVAEAMHGAILADTLRTPWIPFDMRDVELFKWQDWFASMALSGHPTPIKPMLYDDQLARPFTRFPTYLKSRIKIHICSRKFKRLLSTAQPLLSEDEIWQRRLKQLHEKIDYINDTYAQ